MSTVQEGLLIRQVLKGKRKVRLTFVPTDVTCPVDTAYMKIADEDQSAWKKILGKPRGLDINQGIIVVQFHANGNSGTAKFLPNAASQAEITHPFQQEAPDAGAGVGSQDYLGCIDGKKTALAANFNYALAAAECLPQLFK